MCQSAGGGGVEGLATCTRKNNIAKSTKTMTNTNGTCIPAADDVFCRSSRGHSDLGPWRRDGGSVVCWTPVSLSSFRVALFLSTRTQPKTQQKGRSQTSVWIFLMRMAMLRTTSPRPHVNAIEARTLRQKWSPVRMTLFSQLPEQLKLLERREGTRGCFCVSVEELEEPTVPVSTVQSWLPRERDEMRRDSPAVYQQRVVQSTPESWMKEVWEYKSVKTLHERKAILCKTGGSSHQKTSYQQDVGFNPSCVLELLLYCRGSQLCHLQANESDPKTQSQVTEGTG